MHRTAKLGLSLAACGALWLASTSLAVAAEPAAALPPAIEDPRQVLGVPVDAAERIVSLPLGPRWARPGFQCANDHRDPEGRGGPPWVCGPGGVILSGDPIELWEAHRGPRWARPGFQCASDPADPDGRGGPPWVCGPGGTQVGAPGLGDGSGPGGGKGRGPRWAR